MERRIQQLADTRKLLLGVVHLPPLPGSPAYDGMAITTIVEQAQKDAAVLLETGWDGYVLENFGDAPFFKERVPPHVIALMTRVALALPRQSAVCGINVLRNDARGALGVASTVDFDFIRVNVHSGAMVTDQGVIEGAAAATTRERGRLAPQVAILADVAVKHAHPLGSGFDLADAARETAYRGLADGLIVTGKETGSPASLEDLRTVREAVPDRPLFVGSGVDAGTITELLQIADGVIVGSAIKENANVKAPVDPDRARQLVKAARRE